VGSGEWGVENGEWRRENREWRRENREWRREIGDWRLEMESGQIRVRVRFFAAPREAVGTGEIEKEIPAGTTVGELIERLTKEVPALRPYTRFISVAVNRAYVGMQTELHDGDEVACLPPVGGG
jgi:molybdopterin synthase sulfur carrier subunit